ncbi:hypothetical protein JX266_013539 [Neoarthrinium moseri]|nr:hypothetical protein JX266_013539 [Neoarthrinium moseri]
MSLALKTHRANPIETLRLTAPPLLTEATKMRLLQLGAASKLVLAMGMAQNYYPYATLSHTRKSDDEEVGGREEWPH